LQETQANLFEIALARRTPRVFPRFGEDGKQNRREERDYGHDDQNFNEGKTSKYPAGSNGAAMDVVHNFS